MNEGRQSKIEKGNSEEIQTDFPDNCHGSSSVNKEVEILRKYLRIEANLLSLKTHVECKLSDIMRKIESLINDVSNGYF